MQPCSREMQAAAGMNSLLQDLQNQQSQIQNPHHFDPTCSSNDDFLDQMLSSIPSCNSWADLKSPWDLNPTTTKLSSDETPPSLSDNLGAFHPNFDESVVLASKLRQHQISGGGGGASSPVAAAKLMLQQQLLMAARGGILPNDVLDGSSFKPPSQGGGGGGGGDGLFNGFGAGSLNGSNQSSQQQHFQHPQGGVMQGQQAGAAQSFGAGMSQPQASGSTAGGGPGQPKQRVRARRGQATDPHSIAERLRRERIAERMKALQELVPNANKTDKASMLDEIIDYVKFLQLQVKVLSMSRLGGAAAVAPLVADISSEGGGDCVQANNANGGSSIPRASNDSSLSVTEHQVAKLMEEDMGSAMQYLQGKGLCLMPISLATAISTATCHSNRNPAINNHNHNNNNGQGPSSPSVSVLTVQSATVRNGGLDGSVKDTASVSKP